MVLKKEDILDPLQEFLRSELRKEWQAQGHDMGGKAIENIDFVSTVMSDRFSLEIWIPHYAYYLDKGVKAENIPFSGRSGHGGKSAYIQGLIRYAKKRMGLANDIEAKSAAFAMAYTHKREGLPSKKSMRFSSTGKRTGWFSDVADQQQAKIRNTLYALVEQVLVKNWDTLTTKYINLYRSV